MTWLRIDDGFAAHPKVTALSFKDRWTWVSILCYCSKYDTNGWLPSNISEHVLGAKTPFLNNCLELQLLDETDGELRVHDFDHYAPKDPTKAERQARWRKRKRDQDTQPVDAGVDAPVDADVDTEIVYSRAGAARVPVPSQVTNKEPEPAPNRLANKPEQGRAGNIETVGDQALRLLASIKAQTS